MRGFLVLLLIIGAVWFFAGDPSKNIANLFWPESAAPWETVDAFYYPDRSNLDVHQSRQGLDSVEECRSWVWAAAAANNDPAMARGDYECGVERIKEYADLGLTIYRITVE